MRRDEQLSALMDDELSRDEVRFLLKGLETDLDGRETWRRYHDIGDALRDAPEASFGADLSARVMAEIQAEPDVALQANAEPTWMKRVVSFAVAASVATVAVFVANDRGLLGAEQGGLFSGSSQTASIQAAPLARQSDVAEWQQVSPDIQNSINRYLGSQDTPVADSVVAPPIVLVGHRVAEENSKDENVEQTAEPSSIDSLDAANP